MSTDTSDTSAPATPTTEGGAPPVDMDALMGFVFRAVDEVGATLNAALVVLGDKLGYYRALAEHGPSTAAELATRTATAEPYAREWLNAQAAGQYVTYDPATTRYTLPPEQAVALTVEDSPAFLPGLFQIALGTVHDMDHILEAARSGAGYGWHEHVSDVHQGCERFFRPSYIAYLVDAWLPALEGIVPRLEQGIDVLDIGCGHGSSTILMAQAFPRSRFTGVDYHARSIEVAGQRAVEAGVQDRVTFEVASAQALPGSGYGLVTMFDCLHDMGDPVGAAEQVRTALATDGTWMVVEPMAGDHVEDNLNPVGRAFYGFSTLLCTPASLSQDVGLAMGTQAGPARIHDVATVAGFTRFASVAETPFHRVMEIRP
ncbi:class I SAM-dependent methyltransferase [Janibacter sp. LM]|uniref:class I SAM-dependent methyltransferase n=1 Tax=Janibacter sp. LM TaxID=3144845 RepID=UPI0031F67429